MNLIYHKSCIQPRQHTTCHWLEFSGGLCNSEKSTFFLSAQWCLPTWPCLGKDVYTKYHKCLHVWKISQHGNCLWPKRSGCELVGNSSAYFKGLSSFLCPPTIHAQRPPPSPQLILFSSIDKHWDSPQALFRFFSLNHPHPCPPTLFNPSLSTMSYDNSTVLNAVMKILLRNISTCQPYSFHKVTYMTIMKVTTALEYIQEQRVTPLVENEN